MDAIAFALQAVIFCVLILDVGKFIYDTEAQRGKVVKMVDGFIAVNREIMAMTMRQI